MNQNTAEKVIAKPNFKATKTETGAEIKIDLPGVTKDSINIKTEEALLTLKAEKNNSAKPDWQLITDSEIATNYELKLKLSPDLDLSTTVAKLDKGVLSLTISKHEKSLPREITITDE